MQNKNTNFWRSNLESAGVFFWHSLLISLTHAKISTRYHLGLYIYIHIYIEINSDMHCTVNNIQSASTKYTPSEFSITLPKIIFVFCIFMACRRGILAQKLKVLCTNNRYRYYTESPNSVYRYRRFGRGYYQYRT